MHLHRHRSVALVGALAAATVLVAACGTSNSSSASNTTSTTPMASADAANAPFGPGCSAVPTSGSGSFTGMAADPVAMAASNNPLLSTLVTAVQKANLADTLDSAQGITVFAPTNDAFKAVPSATLNALLADPSGKLAPVLKYHVVAGQIPPSQLAGTHTTLEGSTLSVTGSGDDFTVNGSAHVVCGDVHTANATVYIIDGVLVPSS
jgi:uncharacterized surface protein with fasciclin (FAS1) repeats